MSLDLSAILGLLGGGAGVFLLKLYADWSKAKRGDKQEVVGAWQQIADRETGRIEKLEERVTRLEQMALEKDNEIRLCRIYISQLERIIIGAGLTLPDRDE